jgi:hypothetical protein
LGVGEITVLWFSIQEPIRRQRCSRLERFPK